MGAITNIQIFKYLRIFSPEYICKIYLDIQSHYFHTSECTKKFSLITLSPPYIFNYIDNVNKYGIQYCIILVGISKKKKKIHFGM